MKKLDKYHVESDGVFCNDIYIKKLKYINTKMTKF